MKSNAYSVYMHVLCYLFQHNFPPVLNLEISKGALQLNILETFST
jgi:hypothetical protein